MMDFTFDFSQNATRATIREQLRALVGTDAADAAADSARIQADAMTQKHYHNLQEVHAAIEGFTVAQSVKDDLRAVYEILARAEASVHHAPIDAVHFHEVGNAAGVANALEICLLVTSARAQGLGRMRATAVQTGQGTVTCAHGVMNIPAPATAAILDTGIPVQQNTLEGERCTPTSAALIAHFVDEFV